MILDVCNTPEVLEVSKFIISIINVIKVLIPAILVIVNIRTFLKVVINNDDIKKATGLLIQKFIIASFIFFIPSFVSVAISLVSTNTAHYDNCIKNANNNGIDNARIVRIKEEIKILKSNLDTKSYNKVLNDINKLNNYNIKTSYLSELKKYKEYVDLNNDIKKLSSSCKVKDYKKYELDISKINNDEVQKVLIDNLNKYCASKALDTEKGTYQENGPLRYYVMIPEEASTNMPLVLYLHGDGGNDNSAKNNPFYTGAKKAYGENYPFIIVAPVGGMWAETSGRLEDLKDIIDTVCDEYECDTDKIIITGHSRGAIGTWALVDKYPNTFYAAVPVSCNGTIHPDRWKNTKVKAFCGNQGDDINYYYAGMKSNVNKINKAGGNATFIELNAGHGGTPSMAYNIDLFEWLLE